MRPIIGEASAIKKAMKEIFFEYSGGGLYPYGPLRMTFYRDGKRLDVTIEAEENGSGWVEGPDVPKEMEGRDAWQWSEDDGGAPVVSVVPRLFDRDKRYCGGIWFKLITRPEPPEV